MPIELLFVLAAVGLFFLGRGGVKLPQLRRSPAVTTTTVGAAPAPAPKQPGYLSKVRGSMNPVTFFGILVFTAILIIFMLIPGDLVAYVGTILMWALTALILTSIVMLVTGWGSKLVWIPLLIGSIWLAYNPPATTAQQVAQGAETLVEKGLKGMAPSVSPFVPDAIYMSPEEKAAARKAEAAQRAEKAKSDEAQRLALIAIQKQAEDDAKRAYDASFMPAKVGPCLREFTDEVDCVTVRFSFKTEYERYAPPGYCIMVVGDGITSEPLGNESGWRRYRAEEATLVQFFTASGKRCNP